MKELLTPDAWRSEAFAEDLYAADAKAPSPQPQYGRWVGALLGVVPVVVAAAGAVLAVFNHA
jgi:hypothetical protein